MKLRADELTDALNRVADRAGQPAAPGPRGLDDVRRRAHRQTRERHRRTGLAIAAVVVLVGALGGTAAWRSSRHERISVPADEPTTTPLPPIYTRSVPGGSITGTLVGPVRQPVLWGPYSDSGWYRRALGCGPDRLRRALTRQGQPDRTSYVDWPARQLTIVQGPADGSSQPTTITTTSVFAPIGFQQGAADDAGRPGTMGFIATGRTDGEHLRATFYDGAVDDTVVTAGTAVFVGSETPPLGQGSDPWSTSIDSVDASGATTRIFTGIGAMADIPAPDVQPSGPCPDPQLVSETNGPPDAVTQSNAITDTVRRTFGSGAAPDAMNAGVLGASPELSAAFERVTTKLPGYANLPAGETAIVIHEVRFVGDDAAWVRFGRIAPSLPDVEMPGVGGWVKLVHTTDGWRVTRDSICGIGGWNGQPDDVCRPPDNVPDG